MRGNRWVLGTCAFAGPVIFTAAWLVAWPLQDHYSPRREDISALAALDGRYPWIMMLGFMALAVGTIALGLGLMGAVPGRSGKAGSILVLLAGVGLGVAGLARNDCSSELAACKASEEAGNLSWHHQVHDLVSLVIFLALDRGPTRACPWLRAGPGVARLADVLAPERRPDAGAPGPLRHRRDRRLERDRPADFRGRAVDLDRSARAAAVTFGAAPG